MEQFKTQLADHINIIHVDVDKEHRLIVKKYVTNITLTKI